jgi:hypothetical protein
MSEPFESSELLLRIARALERAVPEPPPPPDWTPGAYVWDGARGEVRRAAAATGLTLDLLRGIDGQKASLLANTRRFAQGLPANNALLWGARGMGKSALVKAVHAHIAGREGAPLALVEAHAAELDRLEPLLRLLADAPVRAIVFCDDLAFTQSDTSYRALKTLLEGGVASRPANTLFYATSNRRHLMPRDMSENLGESIHPEEEAEERISLSDRFGLWLGFHACTQDVYLEIVSGYASAFALPIGAEDLRARAIAWAAGRGARSGRTAWQFIQDLAGELGVRLS